MLSMVGWFGAQEFSLGPALTAVHWRQTTLPPALYELVVYALVWSVLELAVGLHLRARRILQPA